MPCVIQPNMPKKKAISAAEITQKRGVRSASRAVTPVSPAAVAGVAPTPAASPSSSAPTSAGWSRTRKRQRGVKSTVRAMPTATNEPCQPKASMAMRMRGTTTKPPSEKPMARMPTASPRRRANQ